MIEKSVGNDVFVAADFSEWAELPRSISALSTLSLILLYSLALSIESGRSFVELLHFCERVGGVYSCWLSLLILCSFAWLACLSSLILNLSLIYLLFVSYLFLYLFNIFVTDRMSANDQRMIRACHRQRYLVDMNKKISAIRCGLETADEAPSCSDDEEEGYTATYQWMVSVC